MSGVQILFIILLMMIGFVMYLTLSYGVFAATKDRGECIRMDTWCLDNIISKDSRWLSFE